MTKHTFDLDGNFVVSKGPRDRTWLAEVSRDLATFPTELVLDVFLHGLKQLGADSASGAATKVEATAAMEKKLDALWAGEWSSRGAGTGDGTRTLALVRLFKAAMPKDKLKAYNALSADDQVKHATANVTDETAIAAEVAKIEAERDARRKGAEARKGLVAELAKGMSFDF